mmetsp:Transcript_59596/g.96473  ORF Transcript_59596/g.96473 Transcript_59596/m.96473 type:complete len:89 (+) Transcript_59596:17-283(+)|eukprot:CAMPEP_0179433944 /NCGR_PEP_ID=MMETSP0799-20121207/18266_1 /TAXON_ID=46947 /ORGANISM="Geminigera cryophila, Strain CCMP2564" /LENGTH=88 /DNA_ID=CAMNT_0021212245 /DNA_START=50 /DNA_END=316 /DNA_ORIENTATION=-
MLFKMLPLSALASTYTNSDGLEFTGDVSAPTGFGFSIEDKYNTSEFSDSYWSPININTRYGGGFGTGVTGSGAGGWTEFDGSGDYGNG